jgi:hypothetical protein
MTLPALPNYRKLLSELKVRIHAAQLIALRAVNKELIALYWDIGRRIDERQQAEGWGKGVVEALSRDLRAEFGEKVATPDGTFGTCSRFIASTKTGQICSHWLQKLPGPKTP